MGGVLPILLLALSGVLVGGVWSMRRQGAGRGAVALVGLLALLAATGGILWLIPGEGS